VGADQPTKANHVRNSRLQLGLAFGDYLGLDEALRAPTVKPGFETSCRCHVSIDA
jgi:hypothetical protein